VPFDLNGADVFASQTNSPEQNFNKAREEHLAGETKKAVLILREALASHPDHRPSLELLGRIHMDNQEYDQAVTVHRQLVNYHMDAKACNALGVSHLMSGEMELAESALAQAVRINPDKCTYQANYAKALILRENWQKASEHLEKALANAGNGPRGQLSQLLDHCREQLGSAIF
jgi:Flp pilus assembly protein TadD